MAKSVVKYTNTADLGSIMSRQVSYRFMDQFIMNRTIADNNVLLVLSKSDVVEFYKVYLSDTMTDITEALAADNTSRVQSKIGFATLLTSELHQIQNCRAEQFYMTFL